MPSSSVFRSARFWSSLVFVIISLASAFYWIFGRGEPVSTVLAVRFQKRVDGLLEQLHEIQDHVNAKEKPFMREISLPSRMAPSKRRIWTNY